MNIRYRVFVLVLFLIKASQSFSQAQVPASMDGLFMVYPSGAITSFSTKTILFMSITHEYYVYSSAGNSGHVGKVQLTGGHTLSMEDLIRGEAYQTLLRKSHKYKGCGVIYAPPVKFKLKPVLNRKTKQYYRDRWDVIQDTVSCKISNVRHHSDGNWCETLVC